MSGLRSLETGWQVAVVLVETDDRVASVWRTILYGDWKWLIARISTFPLTHDAVIRELARTPATLEQKAFQTLLQNRVSHGGKLAPGSGLLKNGEEGHGLQSRWYPQTLQRRIETIVGMRDRLVFLERDGMNVLRDHAENPRAAFFMDPPYTASGSKPGARLYRNNHLEHEELFRIARTLQGDFLMTYSSDPQIRELAVKNGLQVRELQMRNTRHVEQQEFLIGRDLRLVRHCINRRCLPAYMLRKEHSALSLACPPVQRIRPKLPILGSTKA